MLYLYQRGDILKKYIVLLLFLLLLTACGNEVTTNESSSEEIEIINVEELGAMTRFEFNFTIPMAGIFTVKITDEEDGAHFYFETNYDYSLDDPYFVTEKVVDKSVFEGIAEICKKYDVYSWNGYSSSESYEGVMDIDTTSLYIRFATGEKISASASGGFPLNHQEFYEELHEYTLAIAKE